MTPKRWDSLCAIPKHSRNLCARTVVETAPSGLAGGCWPVCSSALPPPAPGSVDGPGGASLDREQSGASSFGTIERPCALPRLCRDARCRAGAISAPGLGAVHGGVGLAQQICRRNVFHRGRRKKSGITGKTMEIIAGKRRRAMEQRRMHSAGAFFYLPWGVSTLGEDSKKKRPVRQERAAKVQPGIELLADGVGHTGRCRRVDGRAVAAHVVIRKAIRQAVVAVLMPELGEPVGG